MLALSLILSVSAVGFPPALSETKNGDGDIYFSYTNSYMKSGLRVAYRPNFQNDFNLKNGIPSIRVYEFESDHYNITEYEQKVLSTPPSYWYQMRRHTKDEYYFVEDKRVTVKPGKWFGYAVVVYNYTYYEVFKETYGFYLVPEIIYYCVIDEDPYHQKMSCSEALNYASTNSFPEEHALTAADIVGIIIGTILGMLLLAFLPVAIVFMKAACIKAKRAMRRSDVRISTETTQPRFVPRSPAVDYTPMTEITSLAQTINAANTDEPPEYSTACADASTGSTGQHPMLPSSVSPTGRDIPENLPSYASVSHLTLSTSACKHSSGNKEVDREIIKEKSRRADQ